MQQTSVRKLLVLQYFGRLYTQHQFLILKCIGSTYTIEPLNFGGNLTNFGRFWQSCGRKPQNFYCSKDCLQNMLKFCGKSPKSETRVSPQYFHTIYTPVAQKLEKYNQLIKKSSKLILVETLGLPMSLRKSRNIHYEVPRSSTRGVHHGEIPPILTGKTCLLSLFANEFSSFRKIIRLLFASGKQMARTFLRSTISIPGWKNCLANKQLYGF